MYQKLSTLFSLNTHDLLKGLIMAILGAVAGLIIPIIESGVWVFDWTSIWHTAVGAAVLYLFKNLLTNSEGKFLKRG